MNRLDDGQSLGNQPPQSAEDASGNGRAHDKRSRAPRSERLLNLRQTTGYLELLRENRSDLPGSFRDAAPKMLDTSPANRYMEDMKLSQLHAAYCVHLQSQGRSNYTISAYRSDFQLILGFLGADDIRALTVERVREYPVWLCTRFIPKQRKGATGKSATGIIRRIASASSFCEWLRKRGDLQMNPFADVDRPKKPKRLPRSMSPEIVEQMLGLDILDTRERAIIATMRFAGLRVGEVAYLQREDVRAEKDGAIRVIGKGNKERVVPILDELLPYLCTWLDERGDHPGPLFTTRWSKPLSRKCVERVLRRIEQKLGVPHFTSHQFRHTCGVQLALMGVPPNLIQEMFGHESLETTTLHTKVAAGHLSMVNKIVAHYHQNKGYVTPSAQVNSTNKTGNPVKSIG
jgi:site-specific recombinase XerC